MNNQNVDKNSLMATVRQKCGKVSSKNLRRTGRIPAVIYGHQEPVAIAVEQDEFQKKFPVISENRIIKLLIDKKEHDVLIKDFQENVLLGSITHLDFFEIEKGKELHTRVPLHFEGTPQGVRLGGLLETFLHEIEVACLPKDIPHNIVVNLAELELGHNLHVSDLLLPAGVKILNSREQVVAAVANVKSAAKDDGEQSETEDQENSE